MFNFKWQEAGSKQISAGGIAEANANGSRGLERLLGPVLGCSENFGGGAGEMKIHNTSVGM